MSNSDSTGRFSLNLISQYRNELFGIAIISIMFFHFAQIHVDFYGNGHTIGFVFTRMFYKYIGSAGVEMFVLLSGMGLYYSLSGNGDIGRFYKRRYKRIFIPYAIVGGIYWLYADIIMIDKGIVRWMQDFFYITFIREGVNNFWFILFIGCMYLIFPFLYNGFFGNGCRTFFAVITLLVAIMIPVAVYEYAPTMYDNIGIALTRAPLFILGTGLGKSIKEGRQIPHAAAAILVVASIGIRYYAVSAGIKGYLARYVSGLLGIALVLVCTYAIHFLRKAEIVRTILQYCGKYSLELYLLHVAMWGMFAQAGISMHRSSRYFAMAALAIILSPVLSRLTGFLGCIKR